MRLTDAPFVHNPSRAREIPIKRFASGPNSGAGKPVRGLPLRGQAGLA
jgi:hypothetical protein